MNRDVKTSTIDKLIDYLINKLDYKDTKESRNNIKIKLIHHHIPKLSEYGILSRVDDEIKYYKNEDVESAVQYLN